MRTKVNNWLVMSVFLLVLAGNVTGWADPAYYPEYYVATDGDDDNPGTKTLPFKTIGRACDEIRPLRRALPAGGVTVWIRGGIYRESVRPARSGAAEAPVRFMACPGEQPVINGADILDVSWTLHKGNIYKASTTAEFEQLFIDGQAMVEARWPNMQFPQQLWLRSCWRSAGVGSRYGKMVDRQLAATNIDWTGAVAVLNVAHQFYTWTRTVQNHSAGNDTFLYSKDLAGITSYADKTKPWENDWYFLTGKLEALDSPGEWFLDTDANILYLWTPNGNSPANHTIEVKRRNYGFEVSPNTDHIEILGLDFFGCTFVFDDCDHCLVANCNLLYPVYACHLSEPGHNQDSMITKMIGNHNSVKNCSFAYGSTSGLKMVGKNNLVENNLIHDFSWYGSLRHVGLHINNTGEPGASAGSIARYNTLFNTGNASLNYRGYENTIEYNHVYNGGFVCEDVALVYTGQPTTAGSIVRYNWVHGCRTESGKGLGIRGDDQTRSLTVHHNVVWDCGRDGIIVKGDFNKVYNNTVFDIGTENNPGNYVNLHTAAEPYKWWRNQYPLLSEQNANSKVYNNAALTITSDNKGAPFPQSRNLANNYCGKDLKLANIEQTDFRPRADSDLVDAGRVIPGYTDGYLGDVPDIGAYEYGDSNYWIPGCRTAKAGVPIPPDKSTLRRTQVDLVWLGGYQGISYDVYLGTDHFAVANANRNSPEFKGNQTNNIYTAGGLNISTDYYWRIDTVKTSETVVGDIWQLKGGIEDFETGDFGKFPWEHGGDDSWTTTSKPRHSGTYSAQAGHIGDDGNTTLQVELDCALGNITFYRKVSSESNSDCLKFYIDGVEKGKWSGEQDWAEVSFPVTSGTRTFEWTYSKDGSESAGDDTAWIDDIVFPID